ncbi:MAG: hypothetical protein J5965_01780, partial [Aeriscardovia sp.]|nr:hypothetical protein [Aeriscardovia sp.]
NFQFIVLLLLVCLPSKADDTNKVTVGLTIDSTAVVAESQSFGRRIEGVVIHSGLDYMLLKFRKTTKSRMAVERSEGARRLHHRIPDRQTL